MDWQSWHEGYTDPDSPTTRRLQVVQDQVRSALDDAPPGPLRVLSLCAGQGHDLLGVLPGDARRPDVTARLVELNARIAAAAQQRVESAGLEGVEVVVGDAGLTDSYVGMVPADLVLVCGVFGSLTDEDVERTIAHLPQLCRSGSEVVWTATRTVPHLFPLVCAILKSHGFDVLSLSDEAASFGVGRHRFVGKSQPIVAGARMFSFADEETLVRIGRLSPP